MAFRTARAQRRGSGPPKSVVQWVKAVPVPGDPRLVVKHSPRFRLTGEHDIQLVLGDIHTDGTVSFSLIRMPVHCQQVGSPAPIASGADCFGNIQHSVPAACGFSGQNQRM